MSDYNDGKWHGWNGGECPVHPETFVEVVGRKMGCATGPAFCFLGWLDATRDNAILAFRVTKEYKEPREYWLWNNERGETVALETYHVNTIHVREVLDT